MNTVTYGVDFIRSTSIDVASNPRSTHIGVGFDQPDAPPVHVNGPYTAVSNDDAHDMASTVPTSDAEGSADVA